MELMEKQTRLIRDYGLLPDPQERLGYLLDLSEAGPGLSADEKRAENRVDGCVSNVWVVGENEAGTMRYRSDSDAPMVKAIAWMLCDFYSGVSAGEVLVTEPEFLRELGLLDALSENRRRGTFHIVARIQALARAP